MADLSYCNDSISPINGCEGLHKIGVTAAGNTYGNGNDMSNCSFVSIPDSGYFGKNKGSADDGGNEAAADEVAADEEAGEEAADWVEKDVETEAEAVDDGEAEDEEEAVDDGEAEDEEEAADEVEDGEAEADEEAAEEVEEDEEAEAEVEEAEADEEEAEEEEEAAEDGDAEVEEETAEAEEDADNEVEEDEGAEEDNEKEADEEDEDEDEEADAEEEAADEVEENGGAENGNAAEAVAEVKEEWHPRPEDPFLTKYRQQVLDAHNAFREHHGVAPLVYCENVGTMAQLWAERLARNDRLTHENVCDEGENIAVKYDSRRQDFPGWVAVNMWYMEAMNYKFPGNTQAAKQNDPVNGARCITGHFTQLVWKDSRRVGIGRAVSSTGRVFTVAKYTPPGNYLGEFDANVLPPKGGKLRAPYEA